jgi:dihydrofolate synthase / folylpolyglutamate synthase
LLEISQSLKKVAVDDWGPFLIEEIRNLENNSMLVITGSLYFIAEVKPFIAKYLKNKTISF